ncbi:MAG: hypothetical protein GTO67_10300 [Gammaproteobacteria bacterium]|nr:hypothetical protein [Gammaproteobacteria bacterium]NIN39020.1 hypothetical protein [Gammaproteobacteria bacterium]NIO66544.1 hypothetical protein [Gammaproteobacteria bacterium]NIQ27705.1 hypothetical protein [Gammaproteobacteria bacterium]NIS04195.1 hypothetical protein [Gammaproteobacteria bacterium]
MSHSDRILVVDDKKHGAGILISSDTVAALENEHDLHPLGAMSVRGTSAPVEMYTLGDGSASAAPPDTATCDC